MFFIENFSGYFPIKANRALASNCNTQTHKLIKTQMIRLKTQINIIFNLKILSQLVVKVQAFKFSKEKKLAQK